MPNEFAAEISGLRERFGNHVGESDQRHSSHEARLKTLENMETKFDHFISRYDTNIVWLLRIASLVGAALVGVLGIGIKIFIIK